MWCCFHCYDPRRNDGRNVEVAPGPIFNVCNPPNTWATSSRPKCRPATARKPICLTIKLTGKPPSKPDDTAWIIGDLSGAVAGWAALTDDFQHRTVGEAVDVEIAVYRE